MIFTTIKNGDNGCVTSRDPGTLSWDVVVVVMMVVEGRDPLGRRGSIISDSHVSSVVLNL